MAYTVADVAKLTGGEVLGDETLVLRGFSPADRAQPGETLIGKVARVESLADAVTEERLAMVAVDSLPAGVSVGEMAEVTVQLPAAPERLLLPNAAVVQHETPEIGWHALKLTDAGRNDPVMSHHIDGAPVFQWHRYRFDVPEGAVHLAETASCGPQAFRHGDNAYGFQFHMEVDEPLISRWLANRAYLDELAEHGHPVDAAQVMSETDRHLPPMRSQAEAVFNAFLDLVGMPERRYTLPSREWV